VNGFPARPQALDILAAIALIYGAKFSQALSGAPRIASVEISDVESGEIE
jgi:hypothetical protein